MTQMAASNMHPAMPPQPRNGLGTSGFVLGLVGLIFSFIPVIGIIAWPLVILGLIFGILGISRVRKGAATNKGLAITGTVTAAIGLVVCIIWAAAFGNAANEINQNMQKLNQTPPAALPPVNAPANGTAAQTRTVVYEVTGSGKALSVTYTTDGMASTEQQQNSPLPFKKEITLPTGTFQVFSLNAQNASSGTISCRITVDGKVLKEATSNGQYSMVMCSGDVTGH